MANLPIFTQSGEESGSIEVADSLVACDVNLQAVRQCVNAYLANRRSGTAKVKGRSEVRGGGAKPWRQKGTGRARAGTRSSPIWRGGGIVFGPQPRSYRKKVNRKVRQLAIRSVVTDKLASERLKVVDSLTIEDGRVKTLLLALSNLKVVGKTLVVTDVVDPMAVRAGANRPGVDIQVVDSLSVYEMLNHDNLVVTKAALEKMQEVWA